MNQEEQIESVILDYLENESVNPSQLLDLVCYGRVIPPPRYSPLLVKQTMWHLIYKGKLTLSSDRKLSITDKGDVN